MVLYPLVYFLLAFISFLPLYTERPYDPRQTQSVIFEILQVATQPYTAWGRVFHILTLAVIGLSIWKPAFGGRAIATYFGLNYLAIAAVQTSGVTPSYGFAVHTGALVADVLLGLLWLWVAWKDRLHLSFKDAPRWRWLLLPFALLVFWSPDYGLAYCLMTQVFVFLLILAWPQVDGFAFRVTAFNGLLYALFNLSHWAVPERIWLGVMHLPLLVMPMVALGLTFFARKNSRFLDKS